MSSAPDQPDTQPTPGAITVDRRMAWGLASVAGMAIGSLGTWASVGPFSVAGTTGGGDGWITLGIAVVIGVLIAVRRIPWLALPAGIVAAGIGIGDAINFLDFEGNEWFSVSIGWGLVMMVVSAASAAAWGATTWATTPARQRVVAGALTVLAIAAAVALGVADRHDDGPSGQADNTLFDANASDESPDDDNAEPTDWDTSPDETGSADTDSGIDDAPDESSTDDPAASAEADSERAAARKDTSIGLAATDDDVTFKVEGFERVSSIATDQYADGPIVPAAGSKLYVATVTWKNNMSESADIFCGGGSTILVDEEGRNFDPDSEAMLEIPENGPCTEQVQPGFKQTAKLVFRTPKDAKPHSLALWNNDAADDFSGDASYVAVDVGR